jgi:hypothetical protein
VPNRDDLPRWRTVVARLVGGPAPRGEQFDLYRRVLASPSPPELARQALRALLEGAMADATFSIGDAQDVMQILKAVDRGVLDLNALRG